MLLPQRDSLEVTHGDLIEGPPCTHGDVLHVGVLVHTLLHHLVGVVQSEDVFQRTLSAEPFVNDLIILFLSLMIRLKRFLKNARNVSQLKVLHAHLEGFELWLCECGSLQPPVELGKQLSSETLHLVLVLCKKAGFRRVGAGGVEEDQGLGVGTELMVLQLQLTFLIGSLIFSRQDCLGGLVLELKGCREAESLGLGEELGDEVHGLGCKCVDGLNGLDGPVGTLRPKRSEDLLLIKLRIETSLDRVCMFLECSHRDVPLLEAM
mmetsp:Transcript_14660/g.34464  ORF Transcript_14660/g.34464 Transcript_14660/m.34464 type:complete len:264 (-) Transcript_14660:146-937(-)